MSELRPYGTVMGVTSEAKANFTSTTRVPYPEDEVQRLKALRALCLLDSPPELVFDRLTRVAQHALKCPIALVSLVDAERQWFKSRQGLDASETPRDIAFCAHAIMSDEVFVVKNALEDPRFATNPLVCGELNIRFYAGRPLRASSGHLIGTLCVIDRVPREPTPEDLHTRRYCAPRRGADKRRGS